MLSGAYHSCMSHNQYVRQFLYVAFKAVSHNVQGIEGNKVSNTLSRWLGSFRGRQPPLPGHYRTEEAEQMSDEEPSKA